MIDLQALMDGLGAKSQRERAGTQMTLGQVIARLEEMNPASDIYGLVSPESYRSIKCTINETNR